MATKKKSAKRGSKRKSATRKAASPRPARKPARKKTAAKPKRRKTGIARAGAVAKTVKQKTLRGIDVVVDTGERAWDALKSTTSNVVESVRERIGGDSPVETELRRE
jgi:hypothetical protein